MTENELLEHRCEFRSAYFSAMTNLVPKWFDIDSAPKDGSYIIGWEAGHDVAPMWYCSVFGRWETTDNNRPMRDCTDRQNFFFECRPTRWMPLPEPPNE